DDIEMNRTFNNGIGMVVVVPAESAQAVQDAFTALGEQVWAIGSIGPRGADAAVTVR
ncbi:MAG: AIR synthase-related protein, partial [Comamonas sp.]